MAQKILMSHLTAAEMREALTREPVILLPLGSFEDQGPHVPMGDYLLADLMAERIARKAWDQGHETYVAPVLPFGGADYFSYMPGGIALSQSTLRSVLTDMINCLVRHNIRRIIVINGHSGNSQAVEDVTRQTLQDYNILIPCFYLWRAAFELLPEVLPPQIATRSAGHGANPLTSIALYLSPDLVRKDRVPEEQPVPVSWGLQTAGFGTVLLDSVNIGVPLDANHTSTNGVVRGDPRLCSAETGEKLCESLTDTGAKLVAHLISQGNHIK